MQRDHDDEAPLSTRASRPAESSLASSEGGSKIPTFDRNPKTYVDDRVVLDYRL